MKANYVNKPERKKVRNPESKCENREYEGKVMMLPDGWKVSKKLFPNLSLGSLIRRTELPLFYMRHMT